jgi:hypothetical protein
VDETTNPGPPERCFDDCPTNSTANTEDCACLSADTAVDSDLRERLVDAVLDVLAEESIATQQEGSQRLADVMLAMVQPALERLTKLAEANGNQARFWADHFHEVEKANRDALGAHHKPGYTVAELITALVGDLDREKRCYQTAFEGREHAWEQLECISELMGVVKDDFAVEAVAGEVERYVDQVKFVTERLTCELDEARSQVGLGPALDALANFPEFTAQLEDDAVAPVSGSDTTTPVRTHCGAVHAEFGECFLDPEMVEHEYGQHESESGRWPVKPGEFAGSDTTEDGGDRG